MHIDLYTPFNRVNAIPARGQMHISYVNMYRKVLSNRHANRQHNRLVLPQQARNLQHHLSKCHGKDLDPWPCIMYICVLNYSVTQ